MKPLDRYLLAFAIALVVGFVAMIANAIQQMQRG